MAHGVEELDCTTHGVAQLMPAVHGAVQPVDAACCRSNHPYRSPDVHKTTPRLRRAAPQKCYLESILNRSDFCTGLLGKSESRAW